MNDQTITGKWYANLDTLGDKITIADPPTDTLRWYIKAVDDKGKASQTSTARRSRSAAATRRRSSTRCSRRARLYACVHGDDHASRRTRNDRDQPNDGLKVVFHWTLVNRRTDRAPITGEDGRERQQRGNYYRRATSFDWQDLLRGRLTVYAVTTDRYGGTTKSPADVHHACRARHEPPLMSILPKLARIRRERWSWAASSPTSSWPRRRTAPRVSSAGAAPEYLLAGADTPVGPGSGRRRSTRSRTPSDRRPSRSRRSPPDGPQRGRGRAARRRRDDGQATEPAVFVDPSGFPRIHPITQFDGGPFQGSNCTLASGFDARPARATASSPTAPCCAPSRTTRTAARASTTSPRRCGAATASRRPPASSGPQQLKNLLASGYGAVIQGVYGEIPSGLRLQSSFTGGHAIYLDGYYPGNAKKGIPEAYYVIDPLGRPQGGLRGRVVAGVHRGRLRPRVRRRPDPGDVGVPARWRAARGRGPGRRPDPARRRGGHPRPRSRRESGATPTALRRSVRVGIGRPGVSPGPVVSGLEPGDLVAGAAAGRRAAGRWRATRAGSSSCPSSTSASFNPIAARLSHRPRGGLPGRRATDPPAPAGPEGGRRLRGFRPGQPGDRRLHRGPTGARRRQVLGPGREPGCRRPRVAR